MEAGLVADRQIQASLELRQRRHQRLGHVLAAVGTEAVLDRAHRAPPRRLDRARPPEQRPRTRRSFSGSFASGRPLDAAGHVDRERPDRLDRLGHVRPDSVRPTG